MDELLTEKEFVAMVERRIEQAGTIDKLALDIGISDANLGMVKSKTRRPGDKTARAFGYEVVHMYRKIKDNA